MCVSGLGGRDPCHRVQLCWLLTDEGGTEESPSGGCSAALMEVPGTGPRQGVCPSSWGT